MIININNQKIKGLDEVRTQSGTYTLPSSAVQSTGPQCSNFVSDWILNRIGYTTSLLAAKQR